MKLFKDNIACALPLFISALCPLAFRGGLVNTRALLYFTVLCHKFLLNIQHREHDLNFFLPSQVTKRIVNPVQKAYYLL